jgi:hypothetical protein
MANEDETREGMGLAEVAERLAEAVDHAAAAETACRRIDTAMKAGFEDLSVRFTRATTSLADRIRELERTLGDRQRESDAQIASTIRQARQGTLLMTALALLASLAAIATVAFALTRLS